MTRPHIGAAVLLVWCLVAAVSGLNASRAREQDRRTHLDAELQALVPHLPASGRIGYVGANGGDIAILFHAVQFALIPRVLVPGAGPEYVIAPADTAVLHPDSMPGGYVPVGQPSGGHQVHRRTR